METKEIFAQRIIELRKEKGWNQAQLAEMVGVSRTSANLYESSTRVPDIQVLAKYAECLEVTADYLLGLSDNRTNETAAIGDTIGLSDEAIQNLQHIFEFTQKKHCSKLQSIAETRENELQTINLILENKKLITAISNYLYAASPFDGITVVDNDGNPDFAFYANENHIVRELYMYHVREELEKLYNKTCEQKETTNAQKDKRQE